MRPLPRLHAVTDHDVLALPDLGVRAAAIAAAGSAVALHARDRTAAGHALATTALRLLALVAPPEAALFVNGRPDIAAATGAHGVQLGGGDLSVSDARRVFRQGWIGCSVHSVAEAEAAVEAGADYLLVGSIYPTPSHRDTVPAGSGLIRQTVPLGRPVIAIGGMNAERATEAKAAGAYGVAAVSALWRASDPAAAALAMLRPWIDSQ